jgi:hypothetical protein
VADLRQAVQSRADELQSSSLAQGSRAGLRWAWVSDGTRPEIYVRLLGQACRADIFVLVTVNPGKELATGARHAEPSILAYMSENGIDP